ncbi:MAG: agmatinase [Chloroflexi bacterium]|nr:agmatinase [Chloroflexota bacterium]
MEHHWFYPPRNFAGLDGPEAAVETARILVLPVPYDSTTSYKTGAREGPQAILDASVNLELFDQELGRAPAAVGIHTLPEVAPVLSGPQAMVERLYQIAQDLLRQDRLLVMLGGEHLLAAAMVRAFVERYPHLTVLQFDAHGDLRDEYLESRYTHACTARRMVELCPLVQVGVRSLSAEEWAFLGSAPPVTTFFAQEAPLSGAQLDRLVAALGPEVYVTFDLDALDPAIMPGVGNPEPGGLGWWETLRILRRVTQQRRVVGFDLVEYCPPEGTTASAFTAAKLAYKLMGYCTQEWGLR